MIIALLSLNMYSDLNTLNIVSNEVYDHFLLFTLFTLYILSMYIGSLYPISVNIYTGRFIYFLMLVILLISTFPTVSHE